MTSYELFPLAFTLFLIANPIGSVAVITSLIKHYPFEKQKEIVLREAIAALVLALFFQFFGKIFLELLAVDKSSLSICGGILLLFLAINTIFSNTLNENSDVEVNNRQEPFIVPIATPIISGPGLLTMIMILSSQVEMACELSVAILLSWLGILIVMVNAPYLLLILRERGLVALEQLTGMLVTFISIEMIINGVILFIDSLEVQ